jgi:putative hydrolase of the HAD superfamily
MPELLRQRKRQQIGGEFDDRRCQKVAVRRTNVIASEAAARHHLAQSYTELHEWNATKTSVESHEMARPRCLIIDFGNVIAFFDHRKAAAQLARLAASPVDPQIVYDAVFSSPLEAAYDSGRITTAEFLTRLRRDLNLRGEDAAIATAWSDMYRPNEPMTELVKAARQHGLRLVLGSNTNELHYNWLRPAFAATLDVFDAEVLSFRIGCRKPDLRFFDVCVRACPDVQARECLYVDDRADFIDVAAHLGLPGIVYRPGAGIEATIARRFQT